jgi:hypothetical protein
VGFEGPRSFFGSNFSNHWEQLMTPDNQALANDLEQLCADHDQAVSAEHRSVWHAVIADFILKNRVDLLECLRNPAARCNSDEGILR